MTDFESSNQMLRIDNQRHEKELSAVVGIPDEDITESDMEGQSKKRSREASIRAIAGDITGSDTEGRSEKGVRRDTQERAD